MIRISWRQRPRYYVPQIQGGRDCIRTVGGSTRDAMQTIHARKNTFPRRPFVALKHKAS